MSLTPTECRDVASLRRVVATGARPKYLFFWSHRPPRSGVDESCLSQWFEAAFEIDGRRYPTAEHFLMAEKARLFGDEENRRRILGAAEPGAAKRFGREVRSFDEEVWRERRFEIAVNGNLAKFRRHTALGEYLSATSRRVLVEASPADRIWGAGLEADDPAVQQPARWPGENLLGFVLMEVRHRLTAGQD